MNDKTINDLRDYDLTRVVVIGTAGSGKTTFAKDVANILEIAHIELDAIHWQPNWTPRGRAAFRKLVAESTSQDRWVVDGNYSAVRDIIWSRATAAVWLNYPFRLVFWRAFSRTVVRVVRRQELFAGNRESFRAAFLSRKSLLWWVISTYSRRRRDYRALFERGTFAGLSLLEFGNPKQADAFLDSLRAASPTRSVQPAA